MKYLNEREILATRGYSFQEINLHKLIYIYLINNCPSIYLRRYLCRLFCTEITLHIHFGSALYQFIFATLFTLISLVDCDSQFIDMHPSSSRFSRKWFRTRQKKEMKARGSGDIDPPVRQIRLCFSSFSGRWRFPNERLPAVGSRGMSRNS